MGKWRTSCPATTAPVVRARRPIGHPPVLPSRGRRRLDAPSGGTPALPRGTRPSSLPSLPGPGTSRGRRVSTRFPGGGPCPASRSPPRGQSPHPGRSRPAVQLRVGPARPELRLHMLVAGRRRRASPRWATGGKPSPKTGCSPGSAASRAAPSRASCRSPPSWCPRGAAVVVGDRRPSAPIGSPSGLDAEDRSADGPRPVRRYAATRRSPRSRGLSPGKAPRPSSP